VPADESLVPRRQKSLELAQSLERARPGEILGLDRHGQVVSPARYSMLLLKHWGWAGGTAALAGTCTWLAVGSGALGVAAGAGVLAFALYARQRGKGIERALTMMARGELDAAEQAIARLEAKRPALEQWLLDSVMGRILWLKGNFQAAIERLERAQPKSRGAQREANIVVLAMLYAVVGRLEEAKQLRQAVDEKLNSEVVRLLRARLDLCIAFHARTLEDLPNQDELFDIGKLALTTDRFGDLLVLLAWASSKRGDTELALHWLQEGLSRLHYDLAVYLPEVAGWVDASPLSRRST
jgi:tetratricopeptide (TPR) repeat protein